MASVTPILNLETFLIPGAKQPRRFNFIDALYGVFAKRYGSASTYAPAVRDCITVLQHMRSPLNDPPTSATTRRQLLLYYRALDFYLSELQLPGELPIQPPPIRWTSSFNPDLCSVLNTLALDRTCTLYNLAVNEATLAAAAFKNYKVNDENHLKGCVTKFQVAASLFDLLAHSQAPGPVDSLTIDLWPESLRVLSLVMLANAQICFVVKHHLYGKMSTGICSRLLSGIAQLFRSAARLARTIEFQPDDSANDNGGEAGSPANNSKRPVVTVYTLLGMPCECLATLFDVLALSVAARAYEDESQVSQGIYRLTEMQRMLPRLAEQADAIRDGVHVLQSIRFVKAEVTEMSTNLTRDAADRLARLEEENRSLYFESIPKTMDAIAAHQIIKVIDVHDTLLATELDPRFEQLRGMDPPDESHRRERVAARAAAIVTDYSASLNDALSSLSALYNREYTGRLRNAFSEPVVDTSAVVAKLRAVHPPHTLRQAQANVLARAADTQAAIAAAQRSLREEEAEDDALRHNLARAGRPPPARQPSAAAAERLRSRADRVKSNLEHAARSDAMVGHDIDAHHTAIERATAFEVHAVPDAASLDLDARTLLAAMDGNVAQRLANLTARRDAVLAALQRRAPPDDVDEEDDEGVDRAYAPQLAEVDALKADIASATEDVQQYLDKLAAAATARQAASDIFRHEAAATKYAEISQHLTQGSTYYEKEAAATQKLAADVAAFVAARREEVQRYLGQPPPPQPPNGAYHNYPGNGSPHYPS